VIDGFSVRIFTLYYNMPRLHYSDLRVVSLRGRRPVIAGFSACIYTLYYNLPILHYSDLLVVPSVEGLRSIPSI
jgi:hypothetical protein